MEEQRVAAQCAEAQESETSHGEAIGRAEAICCDGARSRQRGRHSSGANETKGVDHGKAEAVGGEAPQHNSASAVYRAPCI